MLHSTLPRVPIILVLDQEADQHAGVHVLHVEMSQAPRMARAQLLACVVLWGLAVGESWPGMVRIEVK
jgi:hypothetical protein